MADHGRSEREVGVSDFHRRIEGADAGRTDAFEVGRRALLVIVGFWTLFAVVTVANMMLSPVGDPRPVRPELIGLTFLGAYVWAALTPPLLRLTSRFSLEQGDHALRVLGFFAAAVVVALLVSSALGLVGTTVLDPAPGRRVLGASQELVALIRFRFLNDLLACMLVIAAGMAYDYFRRYQARQEEAALLQARLVEARLEVLRTQLNPHFLFNSLNAVSGLVARDPDGVRRMIARLSEVLRYSLYGAQEQEIPLGEELRVVRWYLEILEIRYQGRLETAVDVAPDVLDARVPTLILQPLVENAMKHGVSQAGGRGRIEVAAHRSGDELVLRVRDTGPGPGWRPAVARRGGGMGLRHTRERLEQLYGSAYRLELLADPPGGTIAEIALPYRVGAAGREETHRA